MVRKKSKLKSRPVAGPKTADVRRPKTLGSKERIQQFARTHGLHVVAHDVSLIGRKLRSICFPPTAHRSEEGPSAVIFDIEQEYRLTPQSCFRSIAGRESFIAKVQQNNLLGIVLFQEHLNTLYQEIGFDIPNYNNSGEASDGPDIFCRDSAWYAKLRSLGFEYHDGEDACLCLTFPARSPKAAKIALMLARHRGLED